MLVAGRLLAAPFVLLVLLTANMATARAEPASATVVRVVDGDTVDVQLADGRIETLN
jgi:endonuclease YncB( thermonuclease family)